ncbi:protein kinase family protein [Streptomyces capparidis]
MADRSTAAIDVADESGAALDGTATPRPAVNGAAAPGATVDEAQVDGEDVDGGGPDGPGPDGAGPDGGAAVRPGADGGAVTPVNAGKAAPDTPAAPEPPAPAADAPASPEPPAAAAEAAPPGTPAPAPEPAPPPPPTEAPELHSGHKLARRYRLEECLTRADGYSSWRAVDEMLRRAVGVHVMASGHPRAKRVLAAARSAALLGDPRFVQVLDAVEEKQFTYVVHEWLPDATELTAVLAAGPLEPYQADQMVRQISAAMAAAHREGLFHLQLTPHSVLCTEDGQFRIRGLAVAAALSGCEAQEPQREDTRAIGALLYAALTHRWPGPDGAYGLAGLPSDLGLVPPDQVRAGVHRGLGELAMRALVNDGATATRHEQPCTTPEDLVRAAAKLPKIRPPEPELPEYRQPGYAGGSYRQPPARTPVSAAPGPAPRLEPVPPTLPGRTGRVLKWAVSALLIVALGLGSWQIATTVFNNGGSNEEKDPSVKANSGNEPKENDNGPRTVPLGIMSGQEYATDGDPDNPEEAELSYDGDKGSYWRTKSYLDGPDAKIVDGRGVIYNLGAEREVNAAEITFQYGGPHTTVHLYAADSMTAALSSMDKLGTQKVTGASATFRLDKPVKTQYVLVWLTAMPHAPQDEFSNPGYKQGITNVSFTGIKD